MPQAIPLEDTFADIIGKAMRGQGFSAGDVAARARVGVSAVQGLCEGRFDEAAARAVAPVLGLGGEQLVAAGKNAWQPRPLAVPGLAQFNTPFGDMTVNSYVAWDELSREAVAFDTGADCAGMLELLRREGLTLKLILLTHSHGDHIHDLGRLRGETGAPAFVGEREPVAGAEKFPAGRTFTCGKLGIGTWLTWGHSPGGITYVISGLARPVAVVGDAVFAGSMGGGGVSYQDALATNRREILSLADDTVLCPGHGPLTTVGEQKQHNPFFS